MNLTDKQEKFALALVAGMSQRQAYKEAYNTVSMSDKTIDEKASILFGNGKVRARYNEIHDRLVKEAEDDAIITAKEVLSEIASIAKDDIKNYLDFYPSDRALSGVAVDIRDSREINTKNVSEVSVGANGQFKFKLYCRDTALYKLADILGLTNGNGVDNNEAVNIVDDL